MPKGPHSSIGSKVEQIHSAEGNLQIYRVLHEVLKFSGATDFQISEIYAQLCLQHLRFEAWSWFRQYLNCKYVVIDTNVKYFW
jgi:hypothetical protein